MAVCLMTMFRSSVCALNKQIFRNCLGLTSRSSLGNKRQFINPNDSFNRQYYNRRFCGRTVLYAGILSWLGLEKEKEKEDPLISIMKLGVLNIQREEYDKAESILHLALKLAQERADMEAQRYIFDLLANNAFHKGDFPKAEKLFIEVIKGLVSSGMEVNDNAIIEISLKLASIYSKQNEKEKAEEGFRFCITAQQSKLNSINLDDATSLTELEKDTALLFAMSMNWYGKHLLDIGKYQQAEIQYEKALSISKKLNGPEHPQTLVLINDIGNVAFLNKDFTKAEECFKKAINIGMSSGTYDLPVFYCNLGSVLMSKGDVKKANVACTKALKSAKRLDDKDAEKNANECLEDIKKMTSDRA